MAGAMAPAGPVFAGGADPLEVPAAGAAAEGELAKDAEAEDPGLGAITLPREAVKRIARSAAPPGARISSEAVAGLQRVAQAFVLYATDRALAEAHAEADRAKKLGRGKAPAASKKTIGVEHVMRFLHARLPPTATKVASLYPDLVPADFRPPGVRLLEQLREQQEKEATLGAAPPAEASGPARDPAAAGGAPAAAGPGPPAVQQLLFGQKRPPAAGPGAADQHQAKKHRAAAAAGAEGPAEPPPAAAAAPKSLRSFFGPPKPGAAPAATGGGRDGAGATSGARDVGAPVGATDGAHDGAGATPRDAAPGGEDAPQESLEVALAAMMDGDGLLTQPGAEAGAD